MQRQPIDQALNDAWRSAESTAVLYFLKRAIAPDSTLQEIQAALTFEPVTAHLQHIRLGEILGVVEAAPEAAPEQKERRQTRSKPASAVKRQRRSAEEINAIKEILVARLQKAPNGIDTPRLTEMICQAGHPIDTMKINLLLNALQAAGLVVSDDGRPKTWRLKVQGRMAAEPMVIKKAQTGAPAQDNGQGGRLLSQAEIHSAAAVLRERLFAS